MAEALINTLGKGRYEAVSAGSNPTGAVHPKSIETLKRHNIDIHDPQSKSWDVFADRHFDLVITVCDAAATSTQEDINAAFDEAFNLLKHRIESELL